MKILKSGSLNFYKLGFLFLLSCSTPYEADRRVFITNEQFQATIEKFTVHKQTYDGLMNVLEVNATLLNSNVVEAQLLRKATAFQWPDVELQKEREKAMQVKASKTQVFLSFYTPESKDDNLQKAETVWRIFLESGTQRWTGEAKKVSGVISETQDIYPRHTRWATPYMMTFLVPTSQIENAPSRLVITGPLGSAQIDFPAQE